MLPHMSDIITPLSMMIALTNECMPVGSASAPPHGETVACS